MECASFPASVLMSKLACMCLTRPSASALPISSGTTVGAAGSRAPAQSRPRVLKTPLLVRPPGTTLSHQRVRVGLCPIDIQGAQGMASELFQASHSLRLPRPGVGHHMRLCAHISDVLREFNPVALLVNGTPDDSPCVAPDITRRDVAKRVTRARGWSDKARGGVAPTEPYRPSSISISSGADFSL